LVNTLYQSQKHSEILRETSRMLKLDGKMIVVDWKNINSPIGPPVEVRIGIDKLKKYAMQHRLRFEGEFFVGQYHYGFIFIKE